MKKRSSKKKVIRRIILVLMLGIIIVGSSYLYYKWKERRDGVDFYAQMTHEALIVSVKVQDGEQEETNDTDDIEGTEDIEEEKMVVAPEIWSSYGENFRAWISSPNTPINYPVMQGSNNTYYLNRLPDGTYNACGSIFMDYKNAPDLSDDNTILYGHYMQGDVMFGTLNYYRKSGYYNQHPYMYLSTDKESYRIEIFTGFLIDASDYLPMRFDVSEEKLEYMERMKQSSDFLSDVIPLQEDRFVTLVTCNGSWETARYALIGRLVPM